MLPRAPDHGAAGDHTGFRPAPIHMQAVQRHGDLRFDGVSGDGHKHDAAVPADDATGQIDRGGYRSHCKRRHCGTVAKSSVLLPQSGGLNLDDAILGMTAQIVSAHISNATVTADALPDLIRSVHKALSTVSSEATEPDKPNPAVPIKASVSNDHLVCLECGKKTSGCSSVT